MAEETQENIVATKMEEEKPADAEPVVTDAADPAVVTEVKAEADADTEMKEVAIESKPDAKSEVKTEEEAKDEPEQKVEEDAKEEVNVKAEEKSSEPADDKEEEKSPTKRGRPKKGEEKPPKTPPTPAEPSRRSGRERRERKSTDFLTSEEKEKKVKVIPEGKGEKLGDIPNIVANLKAVTWSDPHLHMLYKIVFGMGKKKEFKPHLLKFNGLVYPEGSDIEAEKEKVKIKMYKLKMDELKEVMELCDIARSGEKGGKALDKEQLCDRFLAWLEEPKASDKKQKGEAKAAKKSPAKRKESPAPKKGSAKKTPPAKKAKTETPKAKKSPKASSASKSKSANDDIDFNIPGASIEQVREKVKSIVENANRQELTVKGVRKLLEEWLDTDLANNKDAIRALVMEVM